MVLTAMRAGARGYLLKGADQQEVVRAITTVDGGGAVFGAALATRISELYSGGASTPSLAFPELAPREREMLGLIALPAAGTNRSPLRCSSPPRTMRKRVSNVLAKLQALDRTDAIIRARDTGLGG